MAAIHKRLMQDRSLMYKEAMKGLTAALLSSFHQETGFLARLSMNLALIGKSVQTHQSQTLPMVDHYG